LTLCNLDDYRVSMADRRRVSIYRDALAQTVPGRVVCQLGVGYVPLGLMALQLGAERVYAIDTDPQALSDALESVRDHGFEDGQFITICGEPSTVDLPERADVLVAEPLSSLGFCEDTGERMNIARDRLLVPGGVIVPRRVRCYAALAGPTQFARQLDLWARELAEITGIPRDRLVETFRTTTQTMFISPSALLGEWEVWRELDFHDPGRHRQIKPLVLRANRLGIAHGVACCFEADLSEGVTIRSFPDASPTPWQQAFTPFIESIRLSAGDPVYVELMAPEQVDLGAQFETRVLGVPEATETRESAVA
jgi:protein arginine N-methyltransferase 1